MISYVNLLFSIILVAMMTVALIATSAIPAGATLLRLNERVRVPHLASFVELTEEDSGVIRLDQAAIDRAIEAFSFDPGHVHWNEGTIHLKANGSALVVLCESGKICAVGVIDPQNLDSVLDHLVGQRV